MGSRMKLDFVAQLVEQLTLNQWVEGSSPSEVTSDTSLLRIAPCSVQGAIFILEIYEVEATRRRG